ncbi:intein-containing DNA polymerase delta catalytic subunit precursor [Anaeramoeba flamelloides]|uniref:DNA polymerase delta catalytic subunit n=1 Tax=Anaeramoeba flamelloides TaxID=1746091 RepID=A0ABQ8ZDI1_9EUKA|nr:intein-containing DNA polymerase delta catalytic subunit precursor [Anaeramoeba flamelloides]
MSSQKSVGEEIRSSLGSSQKYQQFHKIQQQSSFEKLKDLSEEELEKLKKQVSRDPIPFFDPNKTSVYFQEIETDSYTQRTKKQNKKELLPVIRVFGVTKKGNSVLAHVHGYFPYFFVNVPKNFKESDTDLFKKTLDTKIESFIKNTKHKTLIYIRSVKIVLKKNFYGYQPKKEEFLRIECTLPSHLRIASNILENGFEFPGFETFCYQLFESQIKMHFRFMIDIRMSGGNWIKLPKGQYKVRSNELKESHCQLECDINWKKIYAFSNKGKWQKISLLRVLIFHVQCYGETGKHPLPHKDQVIQISNIITYRSSLTKDRKRNQNINKRTQNDENNNENEMEIEKEKEKEKEQKQEQENEKENNIKNVNKNQNLNNKNKNDLNKLKINIQFSNSEIFSSSQNEGNYFNEILNSNPENTKTPFDNNSYEQYHFVLGNCFQQPGVNIIKFKTEESLLKAWREFFLAVDADIVVGFNMINFSLPYLVARSSTLKLKNFACLGRIKNEEMEIGERLTFSGYSGFRYSKLTPLVGRVEFEIKQIVQLDFKLRRYTLHTIALKFLGKQYDNINYSTIQKLQKGDCTSRTRICKYMIRDCQIILNLFDKLLILITCIELSRVVGIPMNYVFSRGESIKVISLLFRMAHPQGYLIPIIKSNEMTQHPGSLIIDPQVGFYENPIVTLDYASLYPTIIISNNLCYTSFVNTNIEEMKKKHSLNRTPDGHYFVKKELVDGIVPQLLRQLLSERTKTKQQMKIETDPLIKDILNVRQLAIKKAANSVHGFTGTHAGKLPCFEFNAAVVWYSRVMLQNTRDFIVNKYNIKNGYKYNSNVIYGDSVTFNTPILIRSLRSNANSFNHADDENRYGEFLFKKIDQTKNYQIKIRTIESLFLKGAIKSFNYKNNKQYSQLFNFQVWSSGGWSNINQIIRHKTRKKIYRIQTKEGIVDVTEDHSLLSSNYKLLKPKQCNKKTRLLHKYPEFVENFPYHYLKRILNCTKLQKILINDNSKNNNSNHVTKNTLEKTEIKGLKLYFEDQISMAKCYFFFKLLFKNLINISIFIEKQYFIFQYIYLNNNYKGSNVDSNDSNGTIDSNDSNDTIDINDSEYNDGNDDLNLKIISLGYSNNYVYDIDTVYGNFQAGIGSLIVKNTDSVMIDFGKISLEESIQYGHEIAESVTQQYPDPVQLEYEKVYYPYLLIAIKRYAGLLWETSENYEMLDAKGIECVRRDSCLLVKNVIENILIKLMINRDLNGAINYVKRIISDLLRNKLDLSQLIITKGISRPEYKNKQPHVELTEKIKIREPGFQPLLGDRIPYVVSCGIKGMRTYDTAEDPVFLLKHGKAIDANFYIWNQIANPITRIFQHLLNKPSQLLVGKHTNSLTKIVNSQVSDGIMKYTKLKTTCICEKFTVKDPKKLVCKSCKKIAPKIYQDRLNELMELEGEFNILWTKCQRCQYSMHKKIICNNYDCPIFYRRMNVQRLLKRASREISKFEYLDW